MYSYNEPNIKTARKEKKIMERAMDLRPDMAASSAALKQEYQIPGQLLLWRGQAGLRNSDGTGVLIGVTKVGSVQGYLIEDGRRVPMPGRLLPRH